MLFVLHRTVSGIGPNVAGGVLFIDQIRQLRPVMAGGIRRPPCADQAMNAVDADMVLVAKGGDRDSGPLCAVLGRLGLRKLDRPTRIAVLLAQFGGLSFPILGDAAFLDRDCQDFRVKAGFVTPT